MQPQAIIDSYVGDVVRHLPRRQRDDVARELRSLLDDELVGRAGDSGREPDAAITMSLLSDFGRPHDVADRYRPTGFTIIRPSDAPRFVWLALGGVAVIWAVTLPALMLGIVPVTGWDYGAGTWWGRLTVWWLGPGLGALWWPGLLITLTLIEALTRAKRESSSQTWTPTPAPRAVDRDLVNRPGLVAGLAAGLLGASVVIALPWLSTWATALPQPALDALALDPNFVGWRAAWIILLWAASFALSAVVLGAGRWSPVTLRLRGVIDLLMAALLAWWIVAGPIFVSTAADTTTKVILGALSVGLVIDAVMSLRRGAIGRR